MSAPKEIDSRAAFERAIPESGLVLACGQATGHAHVLDHGQLYMFENDLCFRAASSVTLSHEEHGPIWFPAGCYRVVAD